jgi:hypothetical protein
MNDILAQMLAGLNLQPGQCQRVQVNGYHVEIRRLAQEESDFAGTVMLDPWVALGQGEPATHLSVRVEPHPLPVAPDIHSDDVGAQ